MAIKHVNRPAKAICQTCGKIPVSSLNRPHSLKRTKRTVNPNLQPYKNGMICTRCLKSIRRKPKFKKEA